MCRVLLGISLKDNVFVAWLQVFDNEACAELVGNFDSTLIENLPVSTKYRRKKGN